MEILIFFLILLVIGVIVTVAGHGIWLFFAAVYRWFTDEPSPPPTLSSPSSPLTYSSPADVRCPYCDFRLPPNATFCGSCGLPKPSELRAELLQDLAATKRQLERFRDSGKIDADTYAKLKIQLDIERSRLQTTKARPSTAPHTVKLFEVPASQPVSFETSIEEQAVAPQTQPDVPVVTASFVASDNEIVIEPTPSFLPAGESDTSGEPFTPSGPPFGPSFQPGVDARPPRRSFTEMLNSFMEESNIRWGEIVGGLLIIGCSTALVISLWSQISQIPVLKFLIFTTVTAALFGVGLYTEHRWKLPTTSRGTLTIATLLVPLNFLAIAAVSGGTASPGLLIIASEVIAPAVFLCLVYFAGRVLTPSWPHLLGAGVLGSSIGQLLVRHFASPEQPPVLLVALGAFPVACYVACVLWMLRKILADREIDETETIATFISLGAMTFAAILPFGLLLYKSGPVGITMMYLAPLVSLGGFPLLATGTLLWQHLSKKESVASRTAGTSIGILGVMIVLLGMILAWPNPASIVPAALFNFAVFTALAVWLGIPRAHVLAAACFGLAYLVLFHVLAGHIAWQNLRVASLLQVSLSVSSGQSLVALFVLFMGVSEWLVRKRSSAESLSYLIAAGAVASISLTVITAEALEFSPSTYALWPMFGIYALGAFWIAARTREPVFTWIGSSLLLFALAQAFVQRFDVSFPWQAAMLAHASICAVGAIVAWNYEKDLKGILTRPLYQSALITSFAAVVLLFQEREWQTTAMEAERVFWLAGIWLALLWVVRQRVLFTAFQIALTSGVVLTIKGVLQQYAWYAYLPHAFLHPWGLQIQGTALVLLSLGWIALRFATRSERFKHDQLKFVEPLIDSPWSFDRFVIGGVLIAFVLMAIYGALPGVTRELTAQGVDNPTWNIAGFPHQEAFGIGSWLLLGLLVVALLANAWQQRRAVYVLGAVAALIAVPALIAGRFETDIATASAWRWVAALFLLVASLPLLYRERSFTWLSSFGWPETDISDAELAHRIRLLLLGSAIALLLILTLYPALRAIYYMPVHGPAAGIFHYIETRFSYAAPLVIVAFVLIAWCVRERLPDHGFVAGLLLNITVTMTYLLSIVAVNGSMNRVVFAQALQLNAIVFGLYALVWLVPLRHWTARLTGEGAQEGRRLLTLQVILAISTNALLIVPVAIKLIARPEYSGIGTLQTGSLRGWLAFVITVLAAAAYCRFYKKTISAGAVFGVVLVASCLIAFGFGGSDTNVWAASHALLVCGAALGWVMLLARRLASASLAEEAEEAEGTSTWHGLRIDSSWAQECLWWSAIGGILTVLLSMRRWNDDPFSNWWTIIPLLTTTVLFATLNWITLKRRYLYAAAGTFSAAVLVWAVTYLPNVDTPRFVEIQVIALTLPAVLWLALDLRARKFAEKTRSNVLSVHNLAAFASLFLMVAILWSRLLFRSAGFPLLGPALIDWLALGSVAVLLVACLWDRSARYAVASLYIVGLSAAALFLDQLNLPPRLLSWSGMILIAVYTIGVSLIWRLRGNFIELADRWKIPRRMDPSITELDWLAGLNIALAIVVLQLAYWIVLTFTGASYRLTAALSVAAQAVTFALLAEGVRRLKWQRATIGMFVVGIVFLGWAFLVPGTTGTWLNRAVILMVEMFAFVGLYSLVLNKTLEREPDWTAAVRSCIPWIAVGGIVALVFTLSTEVFYQINFGTVLIHPFALIAVGATLIAGIVICVLFALSPKHDPLGLSERGRRTYVYVAEAMLALLFMHIRLTLPWLFSGFFERYWPLVIMAIAYLGVATSEALRRREVHVLAHPIARTGAFLPLLPVIGFWVIRSEVDYSALLFIVGGVYGLLSILRRSFVFGILAAIAGNGGLWYLLNRTDNYQFLQHPQLWLIPVALSVLLAVYLNKDDFTEDQMAGIRYMSLVTIYASSTADIFINGVADSPWLPLVLAALSLAGVFSGILLRIRGLLLLGCVFLLIAIITMIWYASANLGWTWLWYVAGIATGATIIFMFALFEKKRAEVLRVVEGLKEWQR